MDARTVRIGVLGLCCLIVVAILSFSINITLKIRDHDSKTLISTNGTCYIIKREYCLSSDTLKRCLGGDCPSPSCKSYVNCTVSIPGTSTNKTTTSYIGIIYSKDHTNNYESEKTYDAYFLYDPENSKLTESSWNREIQDEHTSDWNAILYSLIALLILFILFSLISMGVLILVFVEYMRGTYTEL